MKRLQHLLFALTLTCIVAVAANAQITIQLKDKSTKEPLVGAVAYNTDKTFQAVSDRSGKIKVKGLENTDTIFIQFIGYKTLRYPLSNATAGSVVQLSLEEHVVSTSEVVLVANRLPEKREDIAQQIEVISAKDIKMANAPSSADLLSSTGKVFVQKSQLGGGSPVLRGLEANRVLIVVDGVRMNNAIYRGGHLQNVITLDPNIQERVEILFGSSSVIYGSDALGGVMHFYSKNPTYDTPFQANVMTRYASVNNEATGHLDFTIGLKNISFLTSVSYSKFGDLRSGANSNFVNGYRWELPAYAETRNGVDVAVPNDDPLLQRNTGYSQLDLTQKVMIKSGGNTEHLFNFQYSASSDIPRYDRLSMIKNDGTPESAVWNYGPQRRLMGSYRLSQTTKNRFYDEMSLTLSFQNIEESRIDRKFGRTRLRTRTEKLNILGLNIDWQKQYSKTLQFNYGFEFYSNEVSSHNREENVQTNEVRTSNDPIDPAETRYPQGGSNMRFFGAYINVKKNIGSWLVGSAGARVSATSLYANFGNNPLNLPFDVVEQDNKGVTGNLGLVAKLPKKWRVAFSLSSGFRTPNVDDAGKLFDSGGGLVRVPNADLRPEKTYNIDLSVFKSLADDRIHLEFTGYHIWLKDMLRISNTTINGQDSLFFDGQMSQVQHNSNIGLGVIYGVFASVRAEITQNILLFSSLSWAKGEDLTEGAVNRNLDHIPPAFGQTSIKFKHRKMRHEVFFNYQYWKFLSEFSDSSVDRPQFAVPDKGIPAWVTLNYRASYNLHPALTLQVAVENILDTHYRTFASGINAPGRNFIVSLRGKF
ncbi:TonB-dependent receptor [Microscilla marina]|uniref:TonB-dependent receptor n=1 Tax=Microscilla marina TaxID=1027 RepID=UPI0006A730D5|nr:TonB-dependent receptor [Microscilla marina]